MLNYEKAEEIRDFAENEGKEWNMTMIARHFGENAEAVRKLLRFESFIYAERQTNFCEGRNCEADADRMRIEKAFSKDEQLWELALRS